jgi:hypothetical protein
MQTNMDMKKLFLIVPLVALMLMVTLQVQQRPQTVAQDDEGECQLMDAHRLDYHYLGTNRQVQELQYDKYDNLGEGRT